MKYLITLIALFCLPAGASAHGSIPWKDVHNEIKGQDPELIAFIDQTFDIAPSGVAMRPLIGEHAGERFAPYDFLPNSKAPRAITFLISHSTKPMRRAILGAS